LLGINIDDSPRRYRPDDSALGTDRDSPRLIQTLTPITPYVVRDSAKP
jgi:hypothetical protein